MSADRPVGHTGSRDWFRSPSWDPEVAAAFEVRLARARADNRPQYVRIQATHLVASPDPATRESGRLLLQRVITDYPDTLQATTASEELGHSLAGEGRLAEAEQALRLTLTRCSQSPTGTSGTSGTPALRLAEVLLDAGDEQRLDEVEHLLADVEPEVVQQRMFRDVVFRYLFAAARTAHRQGFEGAGDLAREALSVLAETTTPIPRHPDLGRASASDAVVTELAEISRNDPPPPGTGRLAEL